VGTPSNDDGSINLDQIRDVSHTIGKSLASDDKYHTIIVKSTVLPGTSETLVIPILEKESGKKAFVDFGVASNPEFLKEGTAIEDFFHTDRVVIGVNDLKTKEILEKLYQPLNAPIFTTTIRTSEMIKYTSNSFLATKISFANEIGNLCKKMGIDSYEVFRGVGLDARINPHLAMRFFKQKNISGMNLSPFFSVMTLLPTTNRAPGSSCRSFPGFTHQ